MKPTLVFFVAAFAAQPLAAFAGCTFYQHDFHRGSSWRLANNERMIMVRGQDVGTTNGSWTYFRPEWNDKISSFKLEAGCTITLWEHADARGRRLETDKTYFSLGGRWNDRASDVSCRCRR